MFGLAASSMTRSGNHSSSRNSNELAIGSRSPMAGRKNQPIKFPPILEALGPHKPTERERILQTTLLSVGGTKERQESRHPLLDNIARFTKKRLRFAGIEERSQRFRGTTGVKNGMLPPLGRSGIAKNVLIRNQQLSRNNKDVRRGDRDRDRDEASSESSSDSYSSSDSDSDSGSDTGSNASDASNAYSSVDKKSRYRTKKAKSLKTTATTSTGRSSHKSKRGKLWRKKRQRRVITILEMNPLPHSRTRVIEQLDKDLALMRDLSRKRRNVQPNASGLIIRRGPIPDVLSRNYQKKPQLIVDTQSGPHVRIPAPSKLSKPKRKPARKTPYDESTPYQQETEDDIHVQSDVSTLPTQKQDPDAAQIDRGTVDPVAFDASSRWSESLNASHSMSESKVLPHHEHRVDETQEQQVENKGLADIVKAPASSSHSQHDPPQFEQSPKPRKSHLSIALQEDRENQVRELLKESPLIKYDANYMATLAHGTSGAAQQGFARLQSSLAGQIAHLPPIGQTVHRKQPTRTGRGGGGVGQTMSRIALDPDEEPVIFQHMQQPKFNDIDMMLIQRPVVIYFRIARQRTVRGETSSKQTAATPPRLPPPSTLQQLSGFQKKQERQSSEVQLQVRASQYRKRG